MNFTYYTFDNVLHRFCEHGSHSFWRDNNWINCSCNMNPAANKDLKPISLEEAREKFSESFK